MISNLVVREALQVFEQNTWERGTVTNAHYGLVMKDFIGHLLPPKALQLQKRYLRRGLYKPHDTKIRYFIIRVNKMVDHLKKLAPFVSEQRLAYDEILEIV